MAEKRKIIDIIHRRPDNSDNETFSKENVYVFYDGASPENWIFDDEIAANEYIANLLKNEGVNISPTVYDPVANPELNDRVMNQFVQQSPEYQQLGQAQQPTPSPSGNEPSEDETEQEYRPKTTPRGEEVIGSKKHTLVKVAAGIGAGVVILAVGSNLINNAASSTSTIKNDAIEFDLEKATLEELMSKLEEGSLAKTEYQKALDFCEHFNKIASQSGNFRMSVDGENYLEITAEEALYTSIVLNGYNETQIREIFGARELDSAEVMKGFESVCEKVRIYSMNATDQTGLEMLINESNSTARNFFWGTENTVMEFNRSVAADAIDTQYSDKVLSTVKNNFAEAKTVNPAVAYLTSMTINGYSDANANNPEFLTFNGALEGATGINAGETVADIIAQIDGHDYLSSVRTSVESAISGHNAKIAAELSESRTQLVEALKSNGDTQLASEVSTRTDLSALEEQITSKGGDITDLYKAYQEKVDAMNPSGIPADAIISKIDQEVTSGKTCDLSKLKDNRIRATYEKTTEDEVVDTNDNNSQSSGEDTPSTETEEEVVIEDNEEFIDQSLDGVDAAIDYVNTPGAYKYDGVLQNKYMDVPYTTEELAQMTPSQIWIEMSMAGIDIPNVETDEQLQAYIEQASEGKAESFEEGLIAQLNAEVSLSEELAQEKLNSYGNMYSEAQNAVDQLNQTGTTYVQGDNLTEEQKGATATVVTDEIEVLDLASSTTQATNDAYAVATTSFDADIEQAATALIEANQNYYNNVSYTNAETSTKAK